MPIAVRRDSEEVVAFRLGAEDIERLIGILSPLGDRFSYSISCSDGLTRHYDNVKDVLAYENPPARQICDFTIRIRSKDKEASASLEFRNSKYATIRVSLDGPEEIISSISTSLNDFFPRIKTWYGFIVRTDYSLIAGTLWFILIGAFAALSFVGLLPKVDDNELDKKTTAEKVHSLLLFCSIPGGLFVFGYLFNRIRNWIFPIAEFAIGQGLQRDAYHDRLRSGLVGIIVIPSLLAALYYLAGKIIG